MVGIYFLLQQNRARAIICITCVTVCYIYVNCASVSNESLHFYYFFSLVGMFTAPNRMYGFNLMHFFSLSFLRRLSVSLAISFRFEIQVPHIVSILPNLINGQTMNENHFNNNNNEQKNGEEKKITNCSNNGLRH